MWRELGEVAQVHSGYAFRGKVENDPNGTVAIIQQKNVSDMLSMSPEDLAGSAPEGAAWLVPEKSLNKFYLDAGDVLLQVRGMQFHSVMFTGQYPAIAAQGVAYFRTGKTVLPQYLCWYLNHPKTTNALLQTSGGTHIPFLSKKTLLEFKVPAPSLDVQRSVIAADRVLREHSQKTQRLLELNKQLIEAATWQAAVTNIGEENND